MKNISAIFNDLFHPEHLLVFYKNDNKNNCRYYVEAFQLDSDGHPLAPHPLSETEARQLAKQLQQSDGPQQKAHFLHAEGLFPTNLLFTRQNPEPLAVWYTPAMVAPLLFQKSLNIPSGPAAIPPLIWKATTKSLSVYAYKEDIRPTMTTRLYHAPFFNFYESGQVCMGTVQVAIPADCSLEKFMALWEGYFFGSYFAHLLIDNSPVEGNIIELWKSLVGTGQPFPLDKLKPSSVTLKQLIA
ncbi:MAG TPA: PRTRC system protein B [Puia sp.]|nr:PRTRC system protein B [Puia sp.]